MPPVIGISMDVSRASPEKRVYELNSDYAEAILRAGGLPVLLPHTDDRLLQRSYFSRLDGLLIPGGADCDPALFGQTMHPQTRLVDTLRQSFDLAMLELAWEKNLPTLGICLGFQLMVVQRGGSLFQDLQAQRPESCVAHRQTGGSAFHEVAVEKCSLLSRIYPALEPGSGLSVNSRHHQGAAEPGSGQRYTAWAPDGLAEAVEASSRRFWLGVQWHPENLKGSLHEGLFQALVAACR